MHLQELYNLGKEQFKKANFENPEIEARTILLNILGKDISYIYSNPKEIISDSIVSKFKELSKRRIEGEPTAYINGKKEFYSRNFIVNPNVLIPRPETELLVEKALDIVDEIKNPLILDLGTGSGCISVTIANEINNGLIIATDISYDALLTAKANHELYRSETKIYFIYSDLLYPFNFSKFDIIISNPPYIAENDIDNIQDEVINFEPKSALFSGDDGLEHISKIIQMSSKVLKNDGWCILEIGYNQAKEVEGIFSKYGFSNIKTYFDINKIERVIKAQCKK